MGKYDFRLTPAYCLYNGVGIKEQHGKEIVFAIENLQNNNLKERLTKAFICHLEYLHQQEDCPECFKGPEKIKFVKGERSDFRQYVSSLYEESFYSPSSEKTKEFEEEREAAAVLLLESILKKAREYNATDIHIEKSFVRYRVQGNLIDGPKLDNEKAVELIRRIKLLAGLNVLESKKSQDGQFYIEDKSPLFIRVSTMGIISNGLNSVSESVVLRLLDTSKVPLSLSGLGFNLQQIDALNDLLKLKNGLILICGPTGSGKSTTAASMLMELCNTCGNSKKIISLEEPPEFLIPGVTQIKIDSEKKNSYSEALHHVFRQDPDVLMIGEIRDFESCETAIRASLTGHLVIATLHTDSVLDSFYRLENFGIDSKILVSVIRGIILQEMNHYEGKVHLLADIALPDKNLNKVYSPDISVQKFEDLFTHYSNVGLVLSKTVGVNKELEKEKEKKKLVAASRKRKVNNSKRIVLNLESSQSVKEEA